MAGLKGSNHCKYENNNNSRQVQTFNVKICNTLCLPESFNTNNYTKLFDYKITFVNSQHKNTYSKSGFVLKNR